MRVLRPQEEVQEGVKMVTVRMLVPKKLELEKKRLSLMETEED